MTVTNTAVATVVTSSRGETSGSIPSKNRKYAASIEEDEDEDKEVLQTRKKPTLPTSGQHTIIKESEFMNHSEKGATGPDRPTKTMRDSKKPEKRTQLLFDRPKLSLKPEWFGNPRLPVELNDMISMMWPYNNLGRSTEQDEYREAQPSKISEPTEFMSYMRPNKPPQRRKITPRFCLPTVDESELAIEAMVKQHERDRPKVKPEAITPDRGIPPLTEGDILKLKQQWYDKYKDILQGTKEELPPLREVNHEINLQCEVHL
jgi:hypothetical protein